MQSPQGFTKGTILTHYFLFLRKTQLPALYLGQSNIISSTLGKGVQKVCSMLWVSEKSTQDTSQTLHGIFTPPCEQEQVQITEVFEIFHRK